jgi:hypothetical protein
MAALSGLLAQPDQADRENGEEQNERNDEQVHSGAPK